MSENTVFEFEIEFGAISMAPKWLNHSRATNFAATWTRIDPQAAGGVAREFWRKATGEYMYIVPSDLTAGAIVEFAADYRTSGGKRHTDRGYFCVQSITDESMLLEKLTEAEAKKRLKHPAGGASELSEQEQQLVDALAELPVERRHMVIRALSR